MIDRNQADLRSTSEGQSYAMFFALVGNDRARFDKLWTWTKANMAGNDITRNQAGAAGCMSGGTDPECAGVFQALAIDWKADGTGTGLPIAGGAAQTVFRPVAR